MKKINDEFLEELGKNFTKIRELLGWRQEDVAVRIGISRSKVVAIESDAKKLSASEAQSLFMACDYEINKAKKTMVEIKKRKNIKRISNLVASSVFLTTPLFASSIIGIAAGAIAPAKFARFIPIVGSIFGSVWATEKAKLKREKQIEELAKEEMLDLQTLEKGMDSTIKKIEENLLTFFNIKEWDSHLFYEKIHPYLKIEDTIEESEENQK